MSLNFRERHGLACIVNVTVQCALERMAEDLCIEPVLDEIESTVQQALMTIRARKLPLRQPSPSIPPASPAVSIVAPTLVDSGPSIVTDLTPPRESPTLLLSDELLTRVLRYLSPQNDPSAAAGLGTIVRASHVCRRWRSLSLRDPTLWNTLKGLREPALKDIHVILRRSGTRALHIDLVMVKVPLDLRIQVLTALECNMDRVRYLSLDLQPGLDTAHALLNRPAPILEELHLRSHEFFNIRIDLFAQNAPLLSTLTIVNPGGQWQPKTCPALENVRTLVLLNRTDTTSLGCVDGLFRMCPRLRDFSVQSVLRGTPESGRPMPFSMSLDALTVRELSEDGRVQQVALTLRAFDHRSRRKVHLRAGTSPTALFIFRELLDPEYFFFMRAGGGESLLVVRDARDKKRIFSQLPADGVDQLLARIQLSSTLASLALWEYVCADDLSALLKMKLPALRIITFFVRGETLPGYMYAANTQHIFAACRAAGTHWECPALETLCFSSHSPVEDVLPPAARQPELSAVELKVFAEETLRADIKSPPGLVLDGVLFKERFKGVEVGSLYQFFSDISMDP